MDLQGKEDWLGGLDSNQDSQIQNLKSCQLDDLPAVVKKGLSGLSSEEKEAFSLFLSLHHWTSDYLQPTRPSALSACVHNILGVNDMVAIENISGLVARDFHGYFLVYSHFHQVLDRRATVIMND
jgi:hypothetical protein